MKNIFVPVAHENDVRDGWRDVGTNLKVDSNVLQTVY